MGYFLGPLKKYAEFSGRASRSEYWGFILLSLLISAFLFLLDGALGTISMESGLGVLSGIYALIVLLPSLAVCVRRLHDIGRSGF